MLKINEVLIKYHKIYVQIYKDETLDSRINDLRERNLRLYILQKLQHLREENLLFGDVVEMISDELMIDQRVLLMMLDDFQSIPEYAQIIQTYHSFTPTTTTSRLKKGVFTKSESQSMMVYVLSEMKVIVEEYQDVQIFIREANPQDLQDVMNGLIDDLFYLYYGVKEDQQRALVKKFNLNEDKSVEKKYELFMKSLKFYMISERIIKTQSNNGNTSQFLPTDYTN